MSADARKRCSRCGETLPLESFALRRASPDGRQNYCRGCHAEWSRARRPRRLTEPPPVGAGQKWCRRCEAVKKAGEFAANKSARDGLQAYCRNCAAAIYRAKREQAGHLVRPDAIPPGHKFCRVCATVKPFAEWSRSTRAADGLQSRCKQCASEAGRRDHLAKSYGLSPDDVASLLRQQQGVCLICLRRPAVHVDHDHVTGEVRGMLCFRCNAALGQFDDTPATLRRAARYLMTAGRWESSIEPYFTQRLAEVDVGHAS